MKPLKIFETCNFKITVEERSVGVSYNSGFDAPDWSFIATFWDKNDCLEQDRNVMEAETYGGALSQAFDWLAEEAKARMIYEADDA